MKISKVTTLMLLASFAGSSSALAGNDNRCFAIFNNDEPVLNYQPVLKYVDSAADGGTLDEEIMGTARNLLPQTPQVFTDPIANIFSKAFKRPVKPNEYAYELNRLLAHYDQGNLEILAGILRDLDYTRWSMDNAEVSFKFENALKSYLNSLYETAQKNDVAREYYIRIMGQRYYKSRNFISTPFVEFLVDTIQNKNHSFSLRKEAAFELELIDSSESIKNSAELFSEDQLKLIYAEKANWRKSPDFRKRQQFAANARNVAIVLSGDRIEYLQEMVRNKFLDINMVDVNGNSLFLRAVSNGSTRIMNWLLDHPKFNAYGSGSGTSNIIDQLRLLGKNELADQVRAKYPDMASHLSVLKSRNDDGSRIIDFIEIEAGGEVPFPFEIMSVKTSNKTWRLVLKMMKASDPVVYEALKTVDENDGGMLSRLKNQIKGSFEPDQPVVRLTPIEIDAWFGALNRMSQNGDAKTQTRLARIFPGHQKGDQYGLPSFKERAFVSTNRGLAMKPFLIDQPGIVQVRESWAADAFVPQLTLEAAARKKSFGEDAFFFLNGKAFYGNEAETAEVLSDSHKTFPDLRMISGKTRQEAIVRGRYNQFTAWNPMISSSVSEDKKYDEVGFRIKRTRAKVN